MFSVAHIMLKERCFWSERKIRIKGKEIFFLHGADVSCAFTIYSRFTNKIYIQNSIIIIIYVYRIHNSLCSLFSHIFFFVIAYLDNSISKSDINEVFFINECHSPIIVYCYALNKRLIISFFIRFSSLRYINIHIDRQGKFETFVHLSLWNNISYRIPNENLMHCEIIEIS